MIRQILVPINGRRGAEGAIEVAIRIAATTRARIDLLLVHEAVAARATETEPWNADRWVRESEYLDRIARTTASHTAATVTRTTLRGDPAEMIRRRATDIRADLIVMKSHTRTGVARAVLGSVADRVLRHTGIPVLMLRASESPRGNEPLANSLDRILVPVDGSPLSRSVLGAVSEMAHCYGSRIVLLRIVPPAPLPVAALDPLLATSLSGMDPDATARVREDAQHEMASVIDHLERLGNTSIEAHVVTGASAKHELSQFVRNNKVDLIALSILGRGASRLVFGAVADRLLRETSAPILFRNCSVDSPDDMCLTEEELIGQLPSLSDLRLGPAVDARTRGGEEHE